MPGFGPGSYEVVPYRGEAFREAHPNTMATIATLFGMKPPAVTRARVLEIGCASGANLIPMAVELPEGLFLGIDQSERQVAEGRATIEAAGLTNVELRRMDVRDAGAELGTFDYIVCHGVFSWVPPEVQQKILSLITATLAPHGVALVSYNIYPGWHMRGVVRDAMLFHINGVSSTQDAIRKSRELLDFLVQFSSGPENSYLTMLRDQRADILQHDDSYLYHEFLEEVNQPLYYHQFLERVAVLGLKAVADAEFSRNACVAPEPVKAALGRVSDDPARQEEYLDLLRGQSFRRTLLCHAGVALLPGPSAAAVEGLQATLYLPPGSLSPKVSATMIDEFWDRNGRAVTIDHPAIKGAVLVLTEQYPHAVAFHDLWQAALDRVSSAGLPTADYGEAERRRLAGLLLQGYGSKWLELHSHMAHFVREPGERPATTPLARHQAKSGDKVASLRHETLDLSRFDRHLLRLLDGHRSRSELVDALDALVTEGTLRIPRTDPGPLDPSARRAIIAESLRQGLSRLGGLGFLVA